MTTPEQQARDMLERMGIRNTHQRESAGELVELANLIAENAAIKAELQVLRGSAGPYCCVYEWDTEFGLVQRTSPAAVNGNIFDRVVPLYTRPAVPLTDEQLRQCFLATNESEPLAEGWPGLERFARAIEAHIKGAKP